MVVERKNWHGASGASASVLEKLDSVSPFSLPESYLSFLSRFNGGQGPISVQPCWLCLYPAEEVAKIELDGTYHEFFPGCLTIGSNGGGEAIALNLDENGKARVVYFDTTNINVAESLRPLASSFDELITLIEISTK